MFCLVKKMASIMHIPIYSFSNQNEKMTFKCRKPCTLANVKVAKFYQHISADVRVYSDPRICAP